MRTCGNEGILVAIALCLTLHSQARGRNVKVETKHDAIHR